MIWIIIGVVSALSVVAVSRWARGERRKVEAEEAARREARRLQANEEALLARLNKAKED